MLDAARPAEGPVEPELLFTRAEWEQARNRLALAGKSLEKTEDQKIEREGLANTPPEDLVPGAHSTPEGS